MKTTTDKCVECGEFFEHHAAWIQDTCKKCRRRIANRKAAPKYYAKETILRKYQQKAREYQHPAYVKPRHGVIVYQPGQFEPDHYTKCAFAEWLKKGEFMEGTRYILDGQEHRI